ncbi:MAG: hypothetical protein KatS3mg023_1999 [Armatimonadota bacterium]|nr:MAG: hypothetical protein KatS3mg023_1999 [Armatimonadota bacterium]
MNPFRRTSVRMWTARAVLCAMLSPILFSPAMAAAAQEKPLPPTVLVLPFAPSQQMSAAVPATLGASLTRAVTSSLRGTGKFDVVQFSAANPSIARAVEEGRLRTAQITPPFEDPEEAIQVAREIGTQYAMAGVIEDYSYDAGAHKASLTVSVQWLDVKSGRALKTVAISAEATGTATSTQDEVNAKVVSEAVNRVLQELAIGEVSVVQPTQVPVKKPSVKRGSSVGWVVLGLGLIAALASGARGGGGGVDMPPPPPQ